MRSRPTTRSILSLVVVAMLFAIGCRAPSTTTPSGTSRLAAPVTGRAALAPGPLPASGLEDLDITPVRKDYRLDPYRGIGTWVDVFDWSVAYTGSAGPPTTPDSVNLMAARGADTLFIQTARYDNPARILEPDLLNAFIGRAHALGMSVVGWYLPTNEDPVEDYRRLMAMTELDLDGITVNIESDRIDNIPLRNRRTVELAQVLRTSLPGATIGAVVLPPVVTEEIAETFWPAFPWRDLAPLNDVWMPMGYWTNRKADSGWRDGFTYTDRNLELLVELLDDPDAVVHPVGGLSEKVEPGQVAGMARAARNRGAIGTSVYDYPTMTDLQWVELNEFTP